MSTAAARVALVWLTGWLVWMQPGALLADSGGAAAAAGSPASTVKDRKNRYELVLPEGWRAAQGPGTGGSGTSSVLAGFEHAASGAVAAIARIDYANTNAWRRKSRDAYYDEIEAGIRTATAGYERLHARSRSLSSEDVPALDLGFRHDTHGGAEVVLMRFVFFRSYSLALTIRIPERAFRRHQRACEKLRASFGPHFSAT